MTYSVVAKSCSRMLIGKTYWKAVALPSILHGINIIDISKTDIDRLQRIENGVYRKILGAPTYAQGTALRGEIGASSVRNRIREGQWKYLRYILVEGNDLLRRIGEELLESRQSKWIKELVNELSERGLLSESVKSETKESIKQKMRDLDTREWKREINEKSSLRIYTKWRKEIGGQEVYTNNQASEILFKARTNNLNLNERKRFRGEDTKCDMCGADNEDLKHFLLWCPAYREERGKITRLQQPYVEDEEDIIGKYLFENRYIEETKREIYKFWTIKGKKRREREENRPR